MTNKTHRPAQEHFLFQHTDENGHTVWKSSDQSQVKFYASASNDLNGALELHNAVIDAFQIKGGDHVLVFAENENGERSVEDIVNVGTPENFRRFMKDRGIQVNHPGDCDLEEIPFGELFDAEIAKRETGQ